MMTGQIRMDITTADNATVVDNAADMIFPNNFEDVNVATLDVTSEEIYCNQKGWSSIPSLQTDSTNVKEAEPRERKRSKTWTYGLSSQVSSKSSAHNGSEASKEKFHLGELRRFSNPDRKSDNNEVLAVDNTSSKIQDKSLSNFSTRSITSSGTVIFPNGSIPNQPTLTVQDMSGFSDVSLAQSNTSVENKDECTKDSHCEDAVSSFEVQSRKHTLGSLFEWYVLRLLNKIRLIMLIV